MKISKPVSITAIASLMLASFLTVTPVHADKPEWAGKGKHKESREEDRDDRGGKHRDKNDLRAGGGHFVAHQHVVVREYYEQEYRGGHCPPGLAKKHNGCMPPGQAKKWHKGRALPRDVVYYDVPPQLVVRLGPPPSGHKYVRVASDILLIAVGTSMVVDAIGDLGRL